MNDFEVHSVTVNRRKASAINLHWLKGQDGSQGADKVDGSAQAYDLVPLIFRAVRLRCDAISSVPIHVYKGEKEVEWPFQSDPAELIWRTEAAMLLRGFAVWLKYPNSKIVEDVRWLNPFFLDVKWDGDRGRLIESSLEGNSGPWTAEQVVFFQEYAPMNDVGPGTAAAAVALEDARLLRYLTRFASRYFEHGAMPVTLLGFEFAPSAEESRRVEKFFRRMASGIENAWKVLALRGKIDPQVMTPPPKDLEMAALNNQARHNVAMAFGIPQTMLEDAANYATAGEHRLSFWQDTVRPRGRIYEGVINQQVLRGMGMRVQLDFEEMGIFQVDEAQRSDALYSLTLAGFDTMTAAEVLGYQLSKDQIARIEREQERKFDQIMARNKEINHETHEIHEKNEKNTANEREALNELRKWERKVEKRLKEGKSAGEFVCEFVGPALAGAIEGALEETRSVNESRRVFADARLGWEGYP